MESKSNIAIIDDLMERYPALITCKASILVSAEQITACYRNGGKLLVCGNGRQHSRCRPHCRRADERLFASPTVGEAFQECLPRLVSRAGGGFLRTLAGALPAISLCAHSALMTAYANDVADDMIYAQQVLGYGRKGDLLVAISTSGNSANIVNAVKAAKALGVVTIALTGAGGGALKSLCDVAVTVPDTETYRIQEYHLPVYHALCAIAEQEFFGENE